MRPAGKGTGEDGAFPASDGREGSVARPRLFGSAGTRAFSRGDRLLPSGDGFFEVVELALEQVDLVPQVRLGAAVEQDAFFLGKGEAPGGGLAVGVEPALGVAVRGAEFLDGPAQAGDGRVLVDYVMGAFPFDIEARQPIGVARRPGLLNLVPEALAVGRPLAAAIRVETLHEAAVEIARGGVGGGSGGSGEGVEHVGFAVVFE